MAYRIEVPDKKGVFLQDFDDDGEDAAGGRLLHLLQVTDHALRISRRLFYRLSTATTLCASCL